MTFKKYVPFGIREIKAETKKTNAYVSFYINDQCYNDLIKFFTRSINVKCSIEVEQEEKKVEL